MEKVRVEIKDNGTPVIKCGTKFSFSVGYQGIATLTVYDKTYYAVSHYYQGIFPVGIPFTINEVQ